MSSKRAPAAPPQLPGFAYQQVLGSGGFADVFLYEQALPRRRVAVKVLLSDKLTSGAVEQFQAEANVMAMLSTHPAIVTIYQAGVSDDGRSYLVMEYCSKPNLQVRARTAPISVAEVLRVGIQVAAAVETAHRAGILHRDIKPANILVTEYNRPALTDFGIATTADGIDPSAGMSIPWSPPESFADTPDFTVRSDVWALGATVYNLLSGRSPFEVPGGRNGGADLIRRIETEPLARLDRADAPASLHVVLERAMAKRPADRFESAVAFARALQKVQIELAHSVTPIDILDDSPAVEDQDNDGELTRVRGIVSIDPHTVPSAGPTWERGAWAAAAPGLTGPTGVAGVTGNGATETDATMLRGPVSIPQNTIGRTSARADTTTAVDEGTVVRGPGGALPATAPAPRPEHPAAPETTTGPQKPRSKKGLWIGIGLAAAAVVVVGAVATASLLAPPSAIPTPVATEPEPVDPQDPVEGFVAAPQESGAKIEGDQAVFSWINPEPESGDSYVWERVTLDGGAGDLKIVADPTIAVPLDGDTQACIDVAVRRENGAVSQETRICAAS